MKEKRKIWVVDDERIVRITLADDLKDNGYLVKEFSDGSAVLTVLKEEKPDLIITDLKMPGIDGITLLKRVKEIDPKIIVLIMTAFGSVDNAVEAMKLGAYDYFTKPFNIDEVILTVEKATQFQLIKEENKILKKHIGTIYDFSSYIGDKKINKELFDNIKLVAKKDSTVLITGETGTGKELVTNIIHFNSNRKNKPFVKVSCAILSREIFESELFGHVKGAFTGAEFDKKGRFELANNGTLYLDDIDDIPYDLQVKLLRAIEQREFEKVGDSKPIPINVRIIASTKKNLRTLVEEGKFREDLFYRLNVFPINIQALRNRKSDIILILNHFLSKFSEGRKVEMSDDALDLLLSYHWPGNIRELKNIAEHLTILVGDKGIESTHIPIDIKDQKRVDICQSIGQKPLDQILSELEIESINIALKRCKYHKSKTAELLGIPPSTLRTKMDKYNIS
ncbi:MAG: sigma-54-dependent Fis family transcriptional regulator [Bacteroidetes bacterium]|nr:sigma-54-dependent Fis family transcriptional regulator [Bacteroidota bacterium]